MSVTPTVHKFRTPLREERGFGVVEVIIAVLLIMVVVSGMVLAMTGGTKLRGAARLQSSMTHVGQRMVEDVASNRSWMKSCAAPASTCMLAPVFTEADKRKLEDVDGLVEVDSTKSIATAVDSKMDGQEGLDEDGVLVDYYDIVLVIRPEASVVARYGADATALTRTFKTSIDRKGNMLKGSLRVEACVVRNQVDERMAIEGCTTSGTTNVKMDGCPAVPPQEFIAYYRACDSAFNWVKNEDASGAAGVDARSPMVKMERVKLPDFTIRNVSTDKTYDAGDAKYVDGAYFFEEIESGTYSVSGLPNTFSVGGISHERWPTKEIPSWHNDPMNHDGSISVQAGIKNNALVMYRPPQTDGGIHVKFDRVVDVYKLNEHSYKYELTDGEESFGGFKWQRTDSYDGKEATVYCDEWLKAWDDSSASWEGSESNDGFEGESDGNGFGSEYYQSPGGQDSPTERRGMSRYCQITDHELPHCKRLTYYQRWYSQAREEVAPDAPDPDAEPPATPAPKEYTMWKTDSWYWYKGEVKYCTFFRNELEHKYWQAGAPSQELRQGAYRTETLEVSPRPTLRDVEYTGSNKMSLTGATTPRHRCTLQGHTSPALGTPYSPAIETADASCPAGSPLHRLRPGLNSPLMPAGDATITGAEIEDPASPGAGVEPTNDNHHALNSSISGIPSWATDAGIWVRPNGTVVGADNVPRTNPTVPVRGKGECYWTGGPPGGKDASQQYEGSCSPCRPYWVVENAKYQNCIILWKTCVDRLYVELSAQESYEHHSGDGASFTDSDPEVKGGGDWQLEYAAPRERIQGASGEECPEYKPAWVCSGSPRIVGGAKNCSAPPTCPGGCGGGDGPKVRADGTQMKGGNTKNGAQLPTGRNG